MKMHSLLPSLWSRDDRVPAEIGSFRKEVEKLFDDFSRSYRLPDTFGFQGKFELNPDMDVHDSEKQVTLKLELPGVDEKDVDISVSGQMITISGEKKVETETKDDEIYRSERSYGSFSRSMSLPFTADADKVEAKMSNGVLTIVVPKPAEAVRPVKKIAIKP
jgi:HSP20 family protein